MRKTFLKRCLLSVFGIAALVCIAACTDVTIRPGMPSYMSRIAIPIFQNRTNQPNLENEITQQLNQEFMMDGRLEIVNPDKANALLQGTVTQYILEPLLMDVHNTPQQYKMRVILYLALKDTKAGKNLWVEEKFEESTTYFVANTMGVNAENEQDARKRLIQQLSRRVIARVIEGF
jgi:hypothetical protein